jgi:hypothetical protein
MHELKIFDERQEVGGINLGAGDKTSAHSSFICFVISNARQKMI